MYTSYSDEEQGTLNVNTIWYKAKLHCKNNKKKPIKAQYTFLNKHNFTEKITWVCFLCGVTVLWSVLGEGQQLFFLTFSIPLKIIQWSFHLKFHLKIAWYHNIAVLYSKINKMLSLNALHFSFQYV